MLVIVNFPDTELLLIQCIQQIVQYFHLVFTVLELSFEIVQFQFAWFFCIFFGFWLRLFFSLSFLSFVLLFLWLSYGLSFGLRNEFDFKGVFATEEDFSEVFGENRDGPHISVPSEKVDVLFSFAFYDHKSTLIEKIT